MGLYYDDKKICFRIHVSYEDHNLLTKHIDEAFSPLFLLKEDEYFSLKFEYEKFCCSHLKTKQKFLYKDIQKVKTFVNGVIIYLNNGFCITIPVGNSEKYNTELYDIVELLKRRCRWKISVIDPISYPEDERDCRYKSDESPISQISFSLTDREIKGLLRYDYLFSEKMIIFIISSIIFLLLSVVLSSIVPLIIAVAIAVSGIVFSKEFYDTSDSYTKNHQGRLQMLMYNDILVVRLNSTDLELEYNSMKHKRNIFGLWRLKCSDFFTYILPSRIVDENPHFFDTLYTKIK